MRRSIVIALVGAAFAAPSPAFAKELVSARVCDGASCATTTDRAQLGALAQDEGPGAPPPLTDRRRSYAVDVAVRDDQKQLFHLRYRYYPAARMVRNQDGTWLNVAPASVATLNALAARVGSDSGPAIDWLRWMLVALGVSGALLAAALLARRRARPVGVSADTG